MEEKTFLLFFTRYIYSDPVVYSCSSSISKKSNKKSKTIARDLHKGLSEKQPIQRHVEFTDDMGRFNPYKVKIEETFFQVTFLTCQSILHLQWTNTLEWFRMD